MTHRYQAIRTYALEKLQSELPEVLKYHSYEHTHRMLDLVEEYVSPYPFTAYELEMLRIAILFHDIGFIKHWKDHEDRSCEIARKVMERQDYKQKDIAFVERLIIATRMPQEPIDDLERVICDIDLDYLGRDNYFERSETLFEEWKALGLVKDRKEWKQKELDFLKNHEFHSIKGRELRQPILKRNISKILSEQKE